MVVEEAQEDRGREPDTGHDGHLEAELAAKYEFRRFIGRGGMGRILLARHRRLDQDVAIKLLHPELISAEQHSRISREARAAARIRSPHVARVFDVGVLSSGTPYIVMEYLEGHDLAALLASKGPLPVDLAAGLLVQALDALAEAHAAGIVHRDLKPANLFVTSDRDGKPFVKVLDFGLVKRTGGVDSVDFVITQAGTVVGSPCYMPPEQLLDAQNADERSDVWSLGATLFELLTGFPPFQGTAMPQLYTAIAHGKIRRVRQFRTDIPEALDDVVARCLSRAPGDRYANAGALLDALRHFAPSTHELAEPLRPPIASNVLESATTETCRSPSSPVLPSTISANSSRIESIGSLTPRRFVRPLPITRIVAIAGALALVMLLSAHRPGAPSAAVTVPRPPGPNSPRARSTGAETTPPTEPPASVPEVPSATAIPHGTTVTPRHGPANGADRRAAPVAPIAPAPTASASATPRVTPTATPSSLYDRYP